MTERTWRVRDYRPEDEAALLDLFREVYGSTMTPEHRRWKLGGSGARVETVAVAVDLEDRPIFQLAGVPLRCRIDGAEGLAMVAVDAMTAISYRRRGVMKAAGRKLLETWRDAGVPLVLGLPNEQYSRATLGWESLFPLRWRVRPLRPWGLLARRLRLPPDWCAWLDAAWHRAWSRRASGIEVREIGDDGVELNGLWERVRDRLSFSVVRDEEWVRWRYRQAPHRRYRVFLAEGDGVARGFAVLSLPDEASRRAVIPEIFAAPGDTAAVRGLVEHLAPLAFLDGAHALVALTVPETWLDRALGDLGFLFSPGAFDVACVRLDPSLSLAALRRRDAWAIAGGDFDIV